MSHRTIFLLSYLAAALGGALVISDAVLHLALLTAQASAPASNVMAQGYLLPVFALLALGTAVVYALAVAFGVAGTGPRDPRWPVAAWAVLGFAAGSLALLLSIAFSARLDQLVGMAGPLGLPALLIAVSVLPPALAGLAVGLAWRVAAQRRSAPAMLAV